MPRLSLKNNSFYFRLRLVCVIAGLLIMGAGFVRNIHAAQEDVIHGLEMTATRNTIHIQDVQDRLDKAEAINASLKDQVVKLQDRFDTMLSIVKAVFGGVATLLLKELTALLNIRLPKAKSGSDADANSPTKTS